jgi:CRP-like cAMP-binding protein
MLKRPHHTANPLVQKLEQFVRLSDDDKQALNGIARREVRDIRARYDIIHEGARPDALNLILEGWGCRHKMLEDGRRQIIAFLIPGDLCDLNVYILRHMDHSIGAITPVKYAQITREDFDAMTESRPRITQALLWDTLVTGAIQREWTVNLGQRSAFERIAHLVCELFIRLRGIGMTTPDGRCQLPLTQNDVAEATGMTPVHVNRTLQELRARGLLEWKARDLHVPDLDALMSAGLFDVNYLHLEHEGAHLDSND